MDAFETREKGRDEEFLGRFGKRVRELRLARHLSQEKLAFGCNLTQTYISQVENGQRNASLLIIRLLAQALKVTLSELFQGVE